MKFNLDSLRTKFVLPFNYYNPHSGLKQMRLDPGIIKLVVVVVGGFNKQGGQSQPDPQHGQTSNPIKTFSKTIGYL